MLKECFNCEGEGTITYWSGEEFECDECDGHGVVDEEDE